MSKYQEALKKARGAQMDWDGQYHVLGYDGWFDAGFNAGVEYALKVWMEAIDND